MKKHTHLSITVLTLLSGLFVASCSNEQQSIDDNKQEAVPVTVASPGTLSNNVIHASGRIESEQTAIISTRVMGFITDIPVKAGDQVKKGQLLVSINSDDIRAKKAQAQAMVAEAEAALKDAQKDQQRFAELYEQHSASAKEFENATLHYNAVKAKAEAARQLQKEAESMLAYTHLVAPFSGVITQKNLNAGSLANPGMPILVLERSGDYKATIIVSENDIAKVKEGATAEIVIKSSGKMIKGKVIEVSPSSQFSGGQFLVGITIPKNDTAGLYAGMYVNAAIASSTLEDDGDVVLVPTASIVYKDQLTGLYTVSEQGTALLRWVKLGKTYGDRTEVLSGLNSTEKFILTTAGKLYNGAPVTVQQAVAEVNE